MRGFNDKAVLALGLLALTLALASLWNLWLAFGMAMWAFIVAILSLGFGAAARRKPAALVMITMLALYGALLAGIAWLDDPQRLRLLLGLPAGTALLVYGVWPIGLVWGVLYGVLFPRDVLPQERLERFLKTYGRKQS